MKMFAYINTGGGMAYLQNTMSSFKRHNKSEAHAVYRNYVPRFQKDNSNLTT